MIGWSQDEVGAVSPVSAPTLKRLEPGDEPLDIRTSTLQGLIDFYARFGIEFTWQDAVEGVVRRLNMIDDLPSRPLKENRRAKKG